MDTIATLMRGLRQDQWRKTNPFSDDIDVANEALIQRPYATDKQKATALRYWLRSNQPCIFGRIAATEESMHFCVLSDEDLYSSDKNIKEKIKRELDLWKQRSLKAQKGAHHGQLAHGFMLLAASNKIAWAAPDESLLRLARRLRRLWGCKIEKDSQGNDLAVETLFLRHPIENRYVRFTFTVDFFAAQGDGRWWHDHRVPGGIAFTANSVGHMARTREWYEDDPTPQTEWAVEYSMLTVENAKETKWGKAIYLEPLSRNGPANDPIDKVCPFRDGNPRIKKLRDKDWSYYVGYLSTDHSIREELFRSDPMIPEEFTRKHRLDLTYLYKPNDEDHAKFMTGEPVSEETVYQTIGHPSTWRSVALGLHSQDADVEALLAKMEKMWPAYDSE